MINKLKKNQAFTVIELAIAMLIVTVLYLMAIPNNSPKTSRKKRQAACFSNQRVLMGAVGMYNMEVKKTEDMMHYLIQEPLIKGGYLKTAISEGPERSCKYFSKGDLAIVDNGYIYCNYHGDVTQKYMKSMLAD